MSTRLALFVVLLALCLVGLVRGSALVRNKRGALTDEAERMVRQGQGVNTNDVGQLADLVARNGAEECLARIICELTQNPKSHGEPGSRFAQSLMKFRQSKHPKVKRYTDAMSAGARAKSGAECRANYAYCSHSSQEIVQVGNKILK